MTEKLNDTFNALIPLPQMQDFFPRGYRNENDFHACRTFLLMLEKPETIFLLLPKANFQSPKKYDTLTRSVMKLAFEFLIFLWGFPCLTLIFGSKTSEGKGK